MKVTEETVLERCAAAKRLEDSGDYEAARDVMQPLWHSVGRRPAVKDLSRRARAEVLLRAGVLTGRLGRAQSLAGSQKLAREMIRESINLFKSLEEGARAAEAGVELAACHNAEGALNASRATLGEVLSGLPAGCDNLKASALIMSAAVEYLENHTDEACALLDEAEALLGSSDDHLLLGKLHNQYGIVLWAAGRSKRSRARLAHALEEYRAALFHFQAAGHVRNIGKVENNLGLLYFELAASGIDRGGLAEATRHLKRSRAIFEKLHDTGQVAQADESMARVLLAQGRTGEAAELLQNAVRVLEEGGQHELLAEALRTQGVVLARLGRLKEAAAAHERAIELVAINRIKPVNL